MSATDAEHSEVAELPPTFNNPIIWEDLPDMEVIRVGQTYYMSASSFAFSPGAPVLKSHDLVEWEHIGHSVPELVFGDRFYLDGRHSGAYGKGIWASTLKYRKSNGLFYWYGPIQGTEQTFIYTASDPGGSWTPLPPINKFYYDLGLLIDEDDTFYLAYGTKDIHVARLSSDGLEERVYTSDEYLEGARMYNIAGTYYIWLTRPYAGQYVLKSTNGPFGPYECREVIGKILSPVPGSGSPHQGALIDTPEGKWYYMAFVDGFPGGRIPVLAPVVFNTEGWPKVEADHAADPGVWRLEYPRDSGYASTRQHSACFKTHLFNGDRLQPCWEWNHNPDNSKWNVSNDRLLLVTATLTENLHLATNTLTHRVVGPKSTATFCIDSSKLISGDRAGVSMFRDKSAYIGIHKDGNISRLVCVKDVMISPINLPVGWLNGHPVALDWSVDSAGFVESQAPLAQDRIWLRIKADITPAFSHGYEKETRYTIFEYSYDGTEFTQLGSSFALSNEATGFVGYRFGVFSFATKTLGGQLSVEQCEIKPWGLEKNHN